MLEQHFSVSEPPTILSLDVEGLDYEILSQIDFAKRQIEILIIEIMEESDGQINTVLLENGYDMRFKTVENDIWVKK